MRWDSFFFIIVVVVVVVFVVDIVFVLNVVVVVVIFVVPAVATIATITITGATRIVQNERGRSLSREDQGGCRQVPDGSARDSVAIALAVAFGAAAVVSRSTAGCRVDASASHPLDSASASKRATSAY